MKKILLGTTALVAVAAMSTPLVAAESINLGLRGYHVGGVAYTDVDTSSGDPNEINFGSDSEIHFRGSTVLDNGLKVSFRADLELEDDGAVDSDADTIDEVYIQFDGGFGRIQFGQNDGVMDQMAVTAPLIFAEHGHNDPDMDPFGPYGFGSSSQVGLTNATPGVGNPIDTYADFSNDNIKLTYFTPDLNGFQFGLSFTPNPCKNDTGYSGCVTTEFGRNFWEASGTYRQDFNNVTLSLSGGYGQGEQGSGAEEPREWSLGGSLDFGGFTVGGSYANKQTGGGFGVTTEQDHWDAGVSYETGPWSFMLSYGTAEGDMDYGSVEDEEFQSWLGGVTYMYGPGMQFGFGLQTLDVDDSGVSDDEDGLAVFFENAITF